MPNSLSVVCDCRIALFAQQSKHLTFKLAPITGGLYLSPGSSQFSRRSDTSAYRHGDVTITSAAQFLHAPGALQRCQIGAKSEPERQHMGWDISGTFKVYQNVLGIDIKISHVWQFFGFGSRFAYIWYACNKEPVHMMHVPECVNSLTEFVYCSCSK